MKTSKACVVCGTNDYKVIRKDILESDFRHIYCHCCNTHYCYEFGKIQTIQYKRPDQLGKLKEIPIEKLTDELISYLRGQGPFPNLPYSQFET